MIQCRCRVLIMYAEPPFLSKAQRARCQSRARPFYAEAPLTRGHTMTTEMIKVADLTPYEKNARHHEPLDVDAIAKSIGAFGFRDPVGVWGPNNIIVEGHGRVMAAKQLGITEVPCIRLDDLTDEQRRAYGLAHNKTAELSTWDAELLPLEIEDLPTYDMTQFGFSLDRIASDWFDQRERMDDSRQENNDEYNGFLDKFEIKKTTDDCYTPDKVYKAVQDWVAKEYGVKPAKMVRPFYPGGDYQHEKYPAGCVVVDNPPFSILSEILQFYAERVIKFFLFAPSLTLFASSPSSSCCALATGADVIYENGASVATSFLTNMEPEELRVRSAPDLRKAVQDAADEVRREIRKELPKYSYPAEVITSTMVAGWSKYGIEFKLLKKDSVNISALDAQKEEGNGIFGKGYLLSERAAAERAAAQRWVLSEREREIVKSLG